MEYETRFIPQRDALELINLYHVARTALAGDKDTGRCARMTWAAKQYAKAHPAVSTAGAYKDLDGLLA